MNASIVWMLAGVTNGFSGVSIGNWRLSRNISTIYTNCSVSNKNLIVSSVSSTLLTVLQNYYRRARNTLQHRIIVASPDWFVLRNKLSCWNHVLSHVEYCMMT
ncbi:hypothetical protein Tco_0917955 [Tanacetum coccineum]